MLDFFKFVWCCFAGHPTKRVPLPYSRTIKAIEVCQRCGMCYLDPEENPNGKRML